MTELTSHTKWVFGVSFSFDDALLATCGADSLVLVWDVEKQTTGPLQLMSFPLVTNKASTLVGHEGTVLSVSFSPKRRNALVSGDSTGVAWLWDATVSL